MLHLYLVKVGRGRIDDALPFAGRGGGGIGPGPRFALPTDSPSGSRTTPASGPAPIAHSYARAPSDPSRASSRSHLYPAGYRSIKLACGLRNDGRMGESQLSEPRNMRVLLEED